MKYSQKSHSSAGYHNMTVVLFTLLCVSICGSLALSPKAQTKTSDEQQRVTQTVPGRNGKIAFTGNGEIYTTEADGSNVQQLTYNPRYDSSPRWSPDGTKIAFVSKHSANHDEIYVMNADGSNQTRLTDNPAGNYSPIFSPDGTRIAFASRRDNHHEIYVMNADGSNQTRLTNGPGGNFSYAWSPDSSRIAFVSARDNPNAINCNITPNCNYEIYVMNADGSNQTRLTNNAGSDGSPKWSPDGTRISFVSSRDEPNPTACRNCNYEIYAMNADGSNQTRLTNSPGSDGSPNWSPDGSRIAFLSNPDNNYDIYVMNADGSNQTRLTNDPAFDDSPVFSPDGSRIAFLSNRDKIDNGWDYDHKIYLINADGGSQTRLINTAVEVYESEVDWHALPLTSPSCPNPIDCAEFFVRQHYLDFLNREPDQGGWDYWTDRITQCGSDARCIHERRIGVSAAFFIELEFQDTGYYVYRFYKASFGRQPNYAEFTSDRSRVVDGSEANKQAFADEWVQRTAFTQAYPSTMGNTEFVNNLFDTAGLTASIYNPQRVQEIAVMNSGRSRALVLRDVIEIPDFKSTPDPNSSRYAEVKQTSQYNPAFVLMQYFGYLRRNLDQGGYDHWLDVLNNRAPNNYPAMVCAFLTSEEYQLRFGASVTRTNQDCGP